MKLLATLNFVTDFSQPKGNCEMYVPVLIINCNSCRKTILYATGEREGRLVDEGKNRKLREEISSTSIL